MPLTVAMSINFNIRTQHPNQWVPECLLKGIKRPKREANQSPSSSAEIRNTWSYTSTPPYVFMARCLVKDRTSSWHCTQLSTGTLHLPHLHAKFVCAIFVYLKQHFICLLPVIAIKRTDKYRLL